MLSNSDEFKKTESLNGVKGVVVPVVQKRKVFYRPRSLPTNDLDQSFFNFNNEMKEKMILSYLKTENPILECLYKLKTENFVIDSWGVSEIQAFCWMEESVFNYCKDNNELWGEGHIQSIKSDKPLYEGQEPFVTDNVGSFYIKKVYRNQYQSDIDYRDGEIDSSQLKLKNYTTLKEIRGGTTAVELPDDLIIIEND